jgi:serine protease 16
MSSLHVGVFWLVLLAATAVTASGEKRQFFTQKIDHFGNVSGTYQQMFTVNESYVDAKATSGVPTFIFLGGEAALQFFEFQEVSALHWAAAVKARYIALEHRYYGVSMPTPDWSTTPLVQLLSVEQALADAAAFIEAMVAQDTAKRYGKWVVFGCSYSGSLSAWFRTKYPNLVVASVAPSGPVLAQIDYASFLPHFAAAATPACTAAARTATQAIQALFRNGQHAYVAKVFNSCSDLSNRTDQLFFEHQVGTALGSANQFNNPDENWPLNTTCASLLSTASPIVGFAQAIGAGNGGQSCNDYTVAGFQTLMRNPANGDRAWWAQKCTEFGFFKSSHAAGGIFFDDVTVDVISSLCEVIFDIKGMMPDVAAFNARWGAKQLNGTNILFTNGNMDPWSLLSITVPEGTVDAITYDAGHCATMTVPTALDPPSLTAARAYVLSFLQKALQ